MTRPSKEHIKQVIDSTREGLGDLTHIPDDATVSPEVAEQLLMLAKLLIGADSRTLAGMAAGFLLVQYGKTAPAVARRVVAMHPRKAEEP